MAPFRTHNHQPYVARCRVAQGLWKRRASKRFARATWAKLCKARLQEKDCHWNIPKLEHTKQSNRNQAISKLVFVLLQLVVDIYIYIYWLTYQYISHIPPAPPKNTALYSWVARMSWCSTSHANRRLRGRPADPPAVLGWIGYSKRDIRRGMQWIATLEFTDFLAGHSLYKTCVSSFNMCFNRPWKVLREKNTVIVSIIHQVGSSSSSSSPSSPSSRIITIIIILIPAMENSKNTSNNYQNKNLKHLESTQNLEKKTKK